SCPACAPHSERCSNPAPATPSTALTPVPARPSPLRSRRQSLIWCSSVVPHQEKRRIPGLGASLIIILTRGGGGIMVWRKGDAVCYSVYRSTNHRPIMG